jgi:hypothetical protein
MSKKPKAYKIQRQRKEEKTNLPRINLYQHSKTKALKAGVIVK